MAPMSSPDTLRAALAPHAATLHGIARDAIRRGFGRDAPSGIDSRAYASALRQTMASFVTLRRGDELRGCVGTAYAARPLAEDVAQNAFHAAFSDNRFQPLSMAEFDGLSVEVSVLTPPEPLPFADEEDLAGRLVPGRDGLMLEHGRARGLFLPQVWEKLPDPHDFLDYLKDKAGLRSAPLDPAVRALRFEAIKFEEAAPANSLADPRRIKA